MKLFLQLILRKKPNFSMYFFKNALLLLIIALFLPMSDKRFSTVTFPAKDIGKIIQNFDSI